ncbi:hypothetical protein SAMN06265375_105121 [Muriicola jejuensis]|uniref:Uncharacterized protein n=1 Tax=Muriicola jejuensis TaxID=504488 RepID=A0A6P0UKQ0_9FLAO|nr:hypothetical protein [Muriicola jejuensis]NER11633.1 hypothetical protein [Muriicola jejuensis]SMP25789.1 hypothetical protein SAMN06265375_105121 [Muriicola jejuensis]
MEYKHTQYCYPVVLLTLAVLLLFVWMYITAAAEPPSYDSGNNLAVTVAMILILLFLSSFVSFTVMIDGNYACITFGLGLSRKKFLLREIAAVKTVQNSWHRGWGSRIWSQPRTWLYAVTCANTVELTFKNGKTYRIGSDEPKILERNILHSIS